jgi:hypothetical protein
MCSGAVNDLVKNKVTWDPNFPKVALPFIEVAAKSNLKRLRERSSLPCRDEPPDDTPNGSAALQSRWSTAFAINI